LKKKLPQLICRYFSIFIFFFIACHNNQEPEQKLTDNTEDNSPENISFKVVDTFPHDTTSYTEGFLFYKGMLFESTGHTNSYSSSRSAFGPVDLKNGRIEIKAEIDKKKYFGEGIAFLKDRIYQLTDTTHIGFIYSAETFKKLGTFTYDGDGWGLTTNGKYLIMSDGSSNLYYREPSTFKIIKTLNVTDNNGPVQNINELEMINGYIYANQWLSDNMLKIDTTTGKVVGRLDLTSLKTGAKEKYPYSEETNGIAFDSVSNKIYVTGKLWPQIYEIQFKH
jgi:glutaminyl-peptide cyclotransferase